MHVVTSLRCEPEHKGRSRDLSHKCTHDLNHNNVCVALGEMAQRPSDVDLFLTA